MPTATERAPVSLPPSEYESLVAWRINQLEGLGFKLGQAETISEVTDVVHAARKLLDRGASYAQVVRILT